MSDWADWRQDRELRDLRDELYSVGASLHAARTSTRRLQSELSKVTGSLEVRLNRLASAFDAFVELSDLRVTLALFDQHARVRQHARQLLGEHPLPGELSDVDGYWLAPALAAVRSTVDGPVATAPLELARSRDPRRATLFHVLAAVLLGRPDVVAASMVAEVLPELDADVAMYQRAVWLLAADAQLDAAARELVLDRAVERLKALPEAQARAAVAQWQKAIKPERDSALPPALGQATELMNAMDAGERLAVLRHWVAAGLEADGKPADEVDPIVKRTLSLLVDEGSPLELPLLVRERQLRKVIESNGQGEPDTWESPVGALITLLQRDVEDEAHPGRRALAIRISAPHILAAAERLAEQARQPAGDAVQARTSAGPVMITRAGPDQASLEKAVSRRLTPMDGQRRKIAYIAAGTGLVLLPLALFAGWGWLVPALVAVGVAAWQFRGERIDRERAREEERQLRVRLRTEAEELAGRYAQACTELNRGRARIDEDLAELRTLLGTGSPR